MATIKELRAQWSKYGGARLTGRAKAMRSIALAAKKADASDDVVLRTQAADQWRELATNADAARAPRYLWWTGRPN